MARFVPSTFGAQGRMRLPGLGLEGLRFRVRVRVRELATYRVRVGPSCRVGRL